MLRPTDIEKLKGNNSRYAVVVGVAKRAREIAEDAENGGVILTEAGLSYLYLGVQLPNPSWGNMIAGGRTYLAAYPWMVIVPGVALMITVLGFNFLGDGLRDVLDPKQSR